MGEGEGKQEGREVSAQEEMAAKSKGVGGGPAAASQEWSSCLVRGGGL